MILILGANGQMGKALTALLGNNAIPLTRTEADLSEPQQLHAQLERHRPSAVINAAAYTAVDKAESERELAFAVNAQSPGVVAEYCKARSIPFMHYSTDYVFNGTGNTPWKETDATAPLSAYGQSKCAGEERVEAVGGQYFIFRTSWVYDAFGKNFLNTMLRLGAEKEELRVVADQWGAPTYAPHLAQATVGVLQRLGIEAFSTPAPPLRGSGQDQAQMRVGRGVGGNDAAYTPHDSAIASSAPPQGGSEEAEKFGIYHLCNRGETSWHGFAEAIFAAARAKGMELKVKRVVPIETCEYPTPAQRPLNSRLNCTHAKEQLGITLPAWQEGLSACMEEKYGSA